MRRSTDLKMDLTMSMEHGEAKLILAISAWPQSRRLHAKLLEHDVCPRCNEAPEDGFHRIWRMLVNVVCYVVIYTNNVRGLALKGRDCKRGFVDKRAAALTTRASL